MNQRDNMVDERDLTRAQTEDRGRLSIPILATVAVALSFIVWFPMGRSEWTPLMWLWVLIVAGVVTANLLVPRKSRTGIAIRIMSNVGFVAFLVVFPIGRANSTLTDLGLYAVYSVCVIGMNLIFGYAGQVSIAQAAFLGIGAYTSVILNTGREIAAFGIVVDLPEVPFLLTVVIAIVVSMAFSILIGMPALRVRGPWLAFVTLAFNVLVFLVFNNEVGVTNGSRGIIIRRDDFSVFGIDMTPLLNYYYVCLAFLVVSMLIVWWIVRSPWGRALKAIRDNPQRAESVGVDVRTYTLLAFAIGSGLAGGAGALYARLAEYIDPRSFYLGQSFDFLFASVIGGLGTLAGPLIGTSFITVVADSLRVAGDWYRFWFGMLAILTMILAPAGIAGTFNHLRAKIAARRRTQ